MRLLHDLRRRRVFRFAGLYIVGAWVVIEVASVFFPAWGIPDSALRYLFIAAAVLFPVTLVFSWIFDVTSKGIVRTQAAVPGEEVDLSLRATDYLILAVLALIGIVVIYGSLTQIVEEVAEHPLTEAVVERIENSIAVLPFANLDANPDTGYFSDGVTEEILHRLSATRALHVLARTSSFAFRSSEDGPARISEILGVQYLLHGSVRRDANQVRVTARLIDEQGLQVWSDVYDRELEAIFVIQSDIASAVASQIVREIVSTGGATAARATENMEAYSQVLVGRSFTRSRSNGWQPRAEQAFRDALELDPDYAAAHAGLAYSLFVNRGPDHVEEAFTAAARAIQLAPDLPEAHAIYGLIAAYLPDIRGEPGRNDALALGEQHLRRALELDPAMSDVYNWLHIVLNDLGRFDEAERIARQGIDVDPLNPALVVNFAYRLGMEGDAERAERMLLRLTQLPEIPDPVPWVLPEFYAEWGRYPDALHWALTLDQPDLEAAYYLALGLEDRAQPMIDAHADADALEKLIRLHPLLHAQGRHRAAMRLIEDFLAESGESFADNYPTGVARSITSFAMAGEYATALRLFEEFVGEDAGLFVDRAEGDSGLQAVISAAYAARQTGNADAADNALSALDELEASDNFDHPAVWAQRALRRSLAADRDGAYQALSRAVDLGWADYFGAVNDPRWGDTLDEPRFAALLEGVQQKLAVQRAAVLEREAGAAD